jgi:hypothetical protein
MRKEIGGGGGLYKYITVVYTQQRMGTEVKSPL